jgi:hypothetical protein
MLTGYQCETVAYYIADSGEYICRDCAVAATSSVTVDKAERGLTNAYGLSGIIRYSMGESNGERTWEAAQERVDDFQHDHPALFKALVREEWRLVDRIAEKFGDLYDERCGQCDALLD